jgi:hypothetical protein
MEEEEAASQTQKKAKFPCLKCKKNVTKNSKSVRCGSCQLWVHVDCEGISAELFNILSHPDKYGGGVSWNCESCLASGKRLEDMIKKCEGRIQDVENRVTDTEGTVKELDKKVEKIDKKTKKNEEEIKNSKESAAEAVYQELREREEKKMNLIIHGVGEADGRSTLEEKKEWDIKSCDNIFRAMEANVKSRQAIKFCRRIGEKKETPRPMLIGLWAESDKKEIMSKAKRLQKSNMREVTIGPDLTYQQRKEEKDLEKKAAAKNQQRTEEEKSKNLMWMVVGKKGEKRLIKGVPREREEGREGNQNRSQPTTIRPRNTYSQQARNRVRTRETESEESEEEQVRETGKRQTNAKRARTGEKPKAPETVEMDSEEEDQP